LKLAFRCSPLPTIYCVPDAVLGARAVRWKQARHKMHDPGVAHHVVCRLVYDPLIDLEFVVRHCARPSFQRLSAAAALLSAPARLELMKSAFGLDGHDPAERDPNYYDAGKSHEQLNRVVHFLLPCRPSGLRRQLVFVNLLSYEALPLDCRRLS
jgi:hypothetical protein